MIPVREALDRILAGVRTLDAETVPLLEARGRVLAEAVDSPIDLPPLANSAMDGYACRAEDVRGATRTAPRSLRIVETVHAGGRPARAVRAGEATRIFTGAPLPEGADGVIRQEDTEPDADTVRVLADRDAGRNIRLAGEDLRRGARILEPGTALTAAALGVLASMARAAAAVHRRARVAILASGDEIADLDEADAILRGEKIASSNSYTLHALVQDAGAVPVPLGIARDTLESVKEKFAGAAASADLIVSTAGVSVGEHDYVHAALADLGANVDFWKVRMRPGSPLASGTVRGVPWIGLPGNPVSTMVCFELFVRPAIRKLQGHRVLHRRAVRASAEEPIRTPGKLTHFLRGVLRETPDGWKAKLTGPQGSGILTSMVRANALLVVPETRTDVLPGESLTAILLGEAGAFAEPPPV